MGKVTKAWGLGVLAIGLLLSNAPAFAHGEKAQEPFLRMRTVQWYDVELSKTKANVNDEVVLKGKFRLSPEANWPRAAAKPDTAFLNVAAAGPVFVRKSSTINGVNMQNSTTLQLGHDYAFEVKMVASHPGRWHIHSMLNVKDAGALIGPGDWVEVSGNHENFVNNIKTLTGETVDLSSYGSAGNISWHLIWGLFAVIWLAYWLSKPIFFSRQRQVAAGNADRLVTKTDQYVAGAVLVGALGLTFVGYQIAEAKYPVTLPLQSAHESVAPLPEPGQRVGVKLLKATYRVPGRSMNMQLEVTNTTGKPIRLGEFSSATVRFLNPEVGFPDEATKKYPSHLLAANGLSLSDNKPINPGETRTLMVQAQDAAWEVERLSSLIYDPDSRFGGLLFFYDSEGRRHIADVGGVLVPTFSVAGT
jgi:methane/ammonia monooxygenase subunit B